MGMATQLEQVVLICVWGIWENFEVVGAVSDQRDAFGVVRRVRAGSTATVSASLNDEMIGEMKVVAVGKVVGMERVECGRKADDEDWGNGEVKSALARGCWLG